QFWGPDHELVARLRELNKIPDATYETFRKAIENENPEICANTMIGLIRVASFLLNNQIKSLEEAFVKDGGLREKMTKVRIEHRNNNGDQNS
ncbi:MAG: four helix bundle protein, partial [Ignavibacteriaceae bacterium]|nr:four helix bundle protein [Ignavibacteriaceae bacterium]